MNKEEYISQCLAKLNRIDDILRYDTFIDMVDRIFCPLLLKFEPFTYMGFIELRYISDFPVYIEALPDKTIKVSQTTYIRWFQGHEVSHFHEWLLNVMDCNND